MTSTVLIADPRAPLARRNPVAKVAALFVLTLPLRATLNPVAPALVLAVEVATVPLFGVRPAALLRRGWPIALSVLSVVAVQLLFGAGPQPVQVAAGLALRVFAVAVPSVLVFGSTDPTDLADALIQNVRAPARFAIGALAALRLLPLLADEWRMLTLARRARGIDGGRNPVAHLRLFVSTAFGLLVGAIRRGTRLARAMDARGFDAGVPRTTARCQRFGAADAALVVAAAAIVTGALVIAALLSGPGR
jgi:energy-coupling factor transport system permease protein